VKSCVKKVLFIGLLLGVLDRSYAQNASPFIPNEVVGSSISNAAQTFEISGSIITTKGTKLCIYDVQAKHSHWVKVGESSENIKVLSYDAKNERAQVVINGETKTLELKKPAVTSQPIQNYYQPTYRRTTEYSAPSPSYTPQASNTSPRSNLTPTQLSENSKQEQESRMLISDLLDIGMQQRKAYEEAKQKADAAAAKAK
jgi:hypothetical protein